jgi:hypothetical protein
MNICVKTGATVRLLEIGMIGPADLFLVGTALIVRFPSPGALRPIAPGDRFTHTVMLEEGWDRLRDLATCVVPLRNAVGELVMGVDTFIDASEVAVHRGAAREDTLRYKLQNLDAEVD